MDDYQPGDVLYQYMHYNGRTSGPYTVDDPVRTKAGKLRLIGPRGGRMTAWWTKENYSSSYTLSSSNKTNDAT